MKFYSTAEVYKTVSDKLMKLQNQIEHKINQFLENKNYGDGLEHWRYLSVINPPAIYEAGFFPETKRYVKKEKSVEFRLRIDYEEMLKANEKEASKLICDSILRSVDIAESELKIGKNLIHIKDFDFQSFRNDLTHLFQQEGWI